MKGRSLAKSQGGVDWEKSLIKGCLPTESQGGRDRASSLSACKHATYSSGFLQCHQLSLSCFHQLEFEEVYMGVFDPQLEISDTFCWRLVDTCQSGGQN